MILKPTDYNDFKYFLRYKFLKSIPKVFYFFCIKKKFWTIFKKELNFKTPETLNEKIQWLKLNDNNYLKTILTDKLLIKEYISDILPSLSYAKVYQACNSFEELNFDNLPNKFVLKTNHSWKTNILIEDKDSISKKIKIQLKKYYKNALKINYAFWSYFEMQYKEIFPKVFAEEFLGNNEDIIDYEVWCFNGNIEFIIVRKFYNSSVFSGYKQSCYSKEWKKLKFNIYFGFNYKMEEEIEKPLILEELLECSRVLSSSFKFVRIDFMEVNSKLYFGEMTFTPHSGFIIFEPMYYDYIYGQKLQHNVK